MLECRGHLVVTVRDVAETCRFYTDGRVVASRDKRIALEFGPEAENLH